MWVHRHADAAVKDLTMSTNGHPSDLVIPVYTSTLGADMPP